MKIKERAKRVIRPALPVVEFFRTSVREWLDDKALRHAAALAYYSIFSLAPLLVIAIALAGFFLGERAVQGEIVALLQDYVGTEVAQFIENMLRNARDARTGWLPTIISLVTMLFGSLVIFSALQDVLNMIWGVQPKDDAGMMYTIRRRTAAFVMILLFGVMVGAAFFATSSLAVAQAYWESWFGEEWGIWRWIDQAVLLFFFTGLFGIIYKLLPDVRMAWRDVWVGAFMTSLLFTVGVSAISFYIGYTGVGTVFGAAGTLAVMLVWIYYTWVIVLMGAEMTQVWARRFGHGIKPGPNAVLRVHATKMVEGRIREKKGKFHKVSSSNDAPSDEEPHASEEPEGIAKDDSEVREDEEHRPLDE